MYKVLNLRVQSTCRAQHVCWHLCRKEMLDVVKSCSMFYWYKSTCFSTKVLVVPIFFYSRHLCRQEMLDVVKSYTRAIMMSNATRTQRSRAPSPPLHPLPNDFGKLFSLISSHRATSPTHQKLYLKRLLLLPYEATTFTLRGYYQYLQGLLLIPRAHTGQPRRRRTKSWLVVGFAY